jgi:hypothetical protein
MDDFVVFGTSKSSQPLSTLREVSLSRHGIFSNFSFTPCIVLHKLFCDLAQLENLHGFLFLYVL